MSLFNEDALRHIVESAVDSAFQRHLGEKPAAAGDYLSVAKAAQIAAVSPQAIRTWIRAGKLKQYNAGRVIRVRRTELEALLASPSAHAGPAPRELTPEEEAHRFIAHRIFDHG
jgi:excisionase family DNA binding protein